MKSIPVFENKYRMLPGEKQKEIPVGIRNFRSPAGLPLPPLPGNGGDAHEVGCFAGRQTSRLAGGLDGGGVAHATTGRLNTCRPPISPNPAAAEIGQLCRKTRPSAHGAEIAALRASANRANHCCRSSPVAQKQNSFFIADSSKTGLRNAALCESLFKNKRLTLARCAAQFSSLELDGLPIVEFPGQKPALSPLAGILYSFRPQAGRLGREIRSPSGLSLVLLRCGYRIQWI